MPDFYELRRQAENLAKKKQWDKAFNTYKILFTNYPERVELSAWDNYWYARSAFEIKKLNFALKLALKLNKLYPQFLYNNNLLTQIKLELLLKNADKMNSQKILKEYYDIIQNIKDDYWASKTVITIAKKLKIKGEHKKALEILIDFDAKRLSTKKFKTPEGKVIPSQQESFYLLVVKLLIINKMFEEAVKITDFALKKIQLTGNNIKWFRLYKADALANMAEYNKSIEQYMQINKRHFWYIDFRIARVLYNMESYDQAFSFACRAALDKTQDTWYKIRIFKFILQNFADRFSDKQLKNLAMMIVALYRKHGFPNNDIVKKISSRFGIEFDNPIDLNFVEKQTYHTIKKLYYGKIFNGKIIKLLKSSGFIITSQKNIYFRFDDIKFDKKLLRPGLRVQFNIIWDYDYGKKQLAQKAVNIKLLNKK